MALAVVLGDRRQLQCAYLEAAKGLLLNDRLVANNHLGARHVEHGQPLAAFACVWGWVMCVRVFTGDRLIANGDLGARLVEHGQPLAVFACVGVGDVCACVYR